MSADPSCTFTWPHRPLVVRMFNGVGRLLRRCGWQRPLNADRILARACRRTGLKDFGEPDVREPLRRLIESLEQENRLTPLGRLLVRRELTQVARARLRIQAALKAQPGVQEERIERPIFIVGLGRTGSTLLHRLLAQDPQLRALHYGETMDPAATALSAPDGQPARRARLHFGLLHRLAPGLRAIHPFDAGAPEECRLLLLHTFRTPMFGQYGKLSAYVQWLEGLGLEGQLQVYEVYRRQLQLLQWNRPPRRWVLKCPVHALGLEALLRTFPDAAVVQTHRDLAEVVPSMLSLQATFRGMFSDDVDPRRLGENLVRNALGRTLGSMRRAREAHPGRVIDVFYRDLVRDPVGTVGKVCEHLGLPGGLEREQSIRDWVSRNPQDKHGRHRYSLEQFGIDRAAVERIFPGYPESFGLTAAGAGERTFSEVG